VRAVECGDAVGAQGGAELATFRAMEMRKTWLKPLPLAAFALFFAPLLGAAQSPFESRIGDYTLLYSAVPSDTLPEEMARRYGLPQRSDAVLLNVTVQREGMNIRARIEARATNLALQQREIEMLESVANDLVSYVGVVEIADREVLDFELDILPEGAERPLRIEFRQNFLPQTREVEVL
jgi:hypothetical protein